MPMENHTFDLYTAVALASLYSTSLGGFVICGLKTLLRGQRSKASQHCCLSQGRPVGSIPINYNIKAMFT